MNRLRLLPIVIVASSALLTLKLIGIVTTGGYVLGTSAAIAQSNDETMDTADPTLSLPPDLTMEDSSPELQDLAPTLEMPPEAETDTAIAGDGGQDSAGRDAGASAPGADSNAEMTVPGPQDAATPDGSVDGDPSITEATACPPGGSDCLDAGVNAAGDALPMTLDGSGTLVPYGDQTQDGSTAALATSLADRRAELDAREAEIDIRLSLLDAAEKRIEERSAALAALEARITTLVEQKKAEEEEQFKAVVSMYEAMKPKEAATILDELDISILLRVARSMNPRKMAPILAKMDPIRAKDLTAALAVDSGEPSLDDLSAENLADLPAIIGN